jgi:hypothetical protein
MPRSTPPAKRNRTELFDESAVCALAAAVRDDAAQAAARIRMRRARSSIDELRQSRTVLEQLGSSH